MGALAAGAFLKAFLNAGNAGDPITRDDVAQVFDEIEYRFSIISDVFDTADSAARAAVTAATDAAGQAERIGQDVKDITEKLVDTIIPHSLSWAIGYVWSHGITPLGQRVEALEDTMLVVLARLDVLESWRVKFVDPNLTRWIGWHEWFSGWPQNVLFTWHDWFEHPAHFGQWAAAPVVGPLVAYLADREHKETRDNLTEIVLAAMSERPEQSWEAVQRWLVTN